MAMVASTRGHRARTGKRDAFRFGSDLLIGLIFSSIYVATQAQQSGFVSIDCGGSPSTNAITTLSWEGDSQYTSTGLSGKVPYVVNSTADNADALATFRYFPDPRSKHCYDLPTPGGNVSFLLRAMFLHGNSTELTLPIQFGVAVNGTTLFTLDYAINSAILTTPVMHEGIFFAAGTVTHFCLVTGTGVPFISSLELRQLDPDGRMYQFKSPFSDNGAYLSTLQRMDCGAQLGSASLRYPDDVYDRLWLAPQDAYSGLASLSTTGVVRSIASSYLNSVPLKVMETAWLSDQPNNPFWFYFGDFGSAVTDLYIAVYFQEIENGASDGDRVFTLDVNTDSVNVSSMSTPLEEVYWGFQVPAGGITNFSFTASINSLKGPIVNAVEVYARSNFNFSATAAEDVDTLSGLQISFSLTDWKGDPCYPVPWDWVGCTPTAPARVDKLLLSSMGIHGSIPATISNLGALTEIHLDNNSLSGIIPDSLAGLLYLVYLFVNDNGLSGPIPAALVAKLGSNFHYAGNSLLGKSPPTKNSIGVIIGAAAGGILALGIVTALLVWYCCCLKKKRQSSADKGEIGMGGKQASSRPSGSGPQLNSADFDAVRSKPPSVLKPAEGGRLSYETVKIATNDFSTKVGQGSYGSVYHGWLDDREVAVKVNNVKSSQGLNEFITEVDILTRVHHRNLVSLIGYCDEGKQLILIYEYQANGTLQEWLHDGRKSEGRLNWKMRLQIAADAAKGLEYLHKGCDPTIIHRDVKSSNILLSTDMMAKVADFGLSKSTPGENTVGYSTVVKGTPGYLDPEYYQFGRLTYKSDVYSYGIVLAELFTGLPPWKNIQYSDEKPQPGLVNRVRTLLERNDIEALADPSLGGSYNPESMWRMADVALSCVEPVGSMRPDFTQVVNGINEAIELEKAFTVHSPLPAPSRSFISRSNSSGYQNLP